MRGRRVLAPALLALLGWAVLEGVTAPANNFCFSIVGDRTGGATEQVYEQVCREISLLGPDFVINAGDAIEGHSDARAAAEWESLRRVWARHGNFPLYFTPGNHDIWNGLSRKLYEKATGRPAFYSFDWQQAHFTVLDNSQTLDLNEEQLRFLEQDLEKNQARDPKFIFFHKPFWIVYLKLGSGEFALHRLARRYGVHCIVSGHAHQFMRMERDGIVYLGVGSSGASIDRGTSQGGGFAQGWFYHHIWARVRGSKVSLTVKEIDGSLGNGRMFPLQEWDSIGSGVSPAR